MYRLITNTFCVILVFTLLLPGRVTSYAWAQDTKPGKEHHPWVRFNPGAWKKVRVITETINEAGNVTNTSTTDTTTLLEGVSAETYDLQVEVTVEVAGKRFEAPPQFLTQSYFGESEGQPVFKTVGNVNLEIDEKKIPCRVFEISSQHEDRKRISKLFFSDRQSPHLLRSESVLTNAAGTTPMYETVETVMALDMPYKVLADIMPTAHSKTVRKNGKGSTLTWSIQTHRVPGAVVAHTSKELDADGKLIRRSTLELIDYGIETDRRVIRRRPFKRTPAGRRKF